MAEEDMSARYLDKSNRFYEIGMKNIKLQLKFLGTKFVVNRPKDNSKWKQVFGGTYSSDSTMENDYEKFISDFNELKTIYTEIGTDYKIEYLDE